MRGRLCGMALAGLFLVGLASAHAQQAPATFTASRPQIQNIYAACATERAALVADRSEAAAIYWERGIVNSAVTLTDRQISIEEARLQRRREEVELGYLDRYVVGFDNCLRSNLLAMARAAMNTQQR